MVTNMGIFSFGAFSLFESIRLQTKRKIEVEKVSLNG
jgi:hypothetical protein